MAGDYIAQNPTAAPEQLANDLVRRLNFLDENGREARLPGGGLPGPQHVFMPMYQEPAPLRPFEPFNNPQSYPQQGPYSASRSFQSELNTQLDALNGTSSRHRLAAAQDLADMVAKVNEDGLADGFKLSPLDNAGRIKIENTKGGPDHSHLSIDLNTGVISDESGTHYISTSENGRVGFKQSQPVSLQSPDHITANYDGNDNLVKATLPDGSSIAKDSTNGFSIYDPAGNALGPASNLVYDGTTLSYRTNNGKVIVGVGQGKMVTEDLETGLLRSKRADQPGLPGVVTDFGEKSRDYRIIGPAAAQQDVLLPPPEFGMPQRPNDSI